MLKTCNIFLSLDCNINWGESIYIIQFKGKKVSGKAVWIFLQDNIKGLQETSGRNWVYHESKKKCMQEDNEKSSAGSMDLNKKIVKLS